MKDGQYNASFWGQICATKHLFLNGNRLISCFAIRGLQVYRYTHNRRPGFPSVSQIPTAEPGDLATPSTVIQPTSTVVVFQGADFSCLRVLWKFDLEVNPIN
ncbi:hypothetical protein EGR_00165 [Echinococcus granulosus]|uniref:Uncharacterized protein n=1 Tax=Echinococcus granulosus TaxID=6210 RepID=W6UW87_ECHGR|nr:hypothetical protein EGR_00165 [Echinococcus granulosus]EUB64896.1 hypothetical protein EGR_00165 [Echinococcus granulosus]